MEFPYVNNSLSLQGSLQQSKAKVNDNPSQTNLATAQNTSNVQKTFDEKRTRVNGAEKSHAESNTVKDDGNQMDAIRRKVREKFQDTSANMKLEMGVEEDTQSLIVLVKDPVTDEVVRQIPPDEILSPAKVARGLQKESNERASVDFKY